MSIVKSQLQDFRSSVAESAGGAISATQIPATETSIAYTANSPTVTVHDAGGFAVTNEIVIDDGTNRERRNITAINGNIFTLNIGFANSYVANTPISTKNALLPDVTAQQANDGLTVFRKFFRRNSNATITWIDVRTWLTKQLTNAAISIGFGIDHADDADGNQGNMTALTANSVIAIISDGADTRTVTIIGENAIGGRQTEILTLNGITEVVGALTFSRLYMASTSALDATRTITLRQGAGGVARGNIGINRRVSFLWFGRRASAGTIIDAEGGNIATDAVALRTGDILAQGNIPIWVRMTVPTGAGATSNNTALVQMRGETG